MAYYVQFEVWIPRLSDETANDSLVEIGFRLTEAFRGFVDKKYGGSTGWNPSLPGFLGHWEEGSNDDLRASPAEEVVPVWVLIGTEHFDDALTDLTMWKDAFEERLHQKVLLVTHQVIQTIGPIGSLYREFLQHDLFSPLYDRRRTRS